jgi:hypothetical protein
VSVSDEPQDAVRWRVLDEAMSEARSKFADMPSDEVDALLEEAVSETRKVARPKAP